MIIYDLPSLKLTASLSLKNAWLVQMKFPFGFFAYFQGRTVGFRECNSTLLTKPKI